MSAPENGKPATRPRPRRAEGQWALGYLEPLNRQERSKRDQDPLEPVVLDRILNVYAKKGFRSIDPADLRGRFRWYGLYSQRPEEDGFLMMRVRVPSGILTHQQMAAVGRISQQFGRNVADVTDRQNFQLHWIRIEDVPEIWARLAAVDLTTRQTCGDVTRNILGCPLAGVTEDEVLDASMLVYAVNARLTGTREFSNLPRKYKIAISGCRHRCHAPEIMDIGLVGHEQDGAPGFDVMVGGGLSTRPMFAQRIGAFVTPEEVVDLCWGITSIFRDYGYRRSREKARLKFLMADWGPERFREILEEKYLGRRLRDGDAPPPVPIAFREHLGPTRQKDGRFAVGFAPEAGRISGDQLVAIAELSRAYGEGRVRHSVQQKVIILDVPEERVEPLVAELDALGLPARPSTFRAHTMACTGLEFCKLAITETKHRARWVVQELEKRLPGATEEIRINLNGCPNSCARFQIADIGLMGVQVVGAEERVEAFQVWLGGHLGDGHAFGRKVRKLRVPADALPDYLAGLIQEYRRRNGDGRPFHEVVNALSDDELYEFAMTAADDRAFEDAMEGKIDSGVPVFEMQKQLDE